MTTTRYYIERETTIPGEWMRLPDISPKGLMESQRTAIDLMTNSYDQGKWTRFRVVEVTETVVGVYG